MEDEEVQNVVQPQEELPRDIPPYRWFIGVMGDGNYRFITPQALKKAELYIGQHGGGVYTHAGYLVFASNKRWWEWLVNAKRDTQDLPEGSPQIDVQNIDCIFSPEALQWVEENEELLKAKGGKYYENIPRH